MTTCASQWRSWEGGRHTHTHTPSPGEASLGSPIHLHYIRETPKDTVSACGVTVPPSSPRGWAGGTYPQPCRQSTGWQGSGQPAVGSPDLLHTRTSLEKHESNDGHAQLVGCLSRVQGSWGKGKQELLWEISEMEKDVPLPQRTDGNIGLN